MAKKILMLTYEFSPFCGGIGTYASQLAMAASTLGHDITVVAPDYGQNLGKSDRETFAFEVIRYRGSIYSYRNLPGMLWRIWRQVQRDKYDTIHAVDWPHILSLAFLNRFRRIPFVATVYGTDLLSCLDCRQVKYLRLSDMFSSPAAIFAISEFTKSLCLQKCPEVPSDRVLVTSLGVEEGWFRPTGKSRHIFEKYDIPLGDQIILTVARLDERKGHRTVLKALAKLPPALKERVTYTIVGAGDDEGYVEDLKRLASEGGAKVIFAGRIGNDDLLAFYASASLFCMPGEPHPKKVEGFGLVYLEAAAQGLPSIGSRVGAVPEIVLDGQTGILVEPLDVDGVAKALEQVLSANSFRESLGRAACANARKYTWRRCAEQTYGM